MADWRGGLPAGMTTSASREVDPTQVGTSDIVLLQAALRSGHALFAISDAPVADVTTNLPSSTQPLGVQIRLRSLAAANKFVRFGRAAILHR